LFSFFETMQNRYKVFNNSLPLVTIFRVSLDVVVRRIMARPRGNYAFTAARRDLIIRAALETFGEYGFNGSSLKQVAEVVGISEAGVLHHFGTKSNLLIEVLRSRDDHGTELVPMKGDDGIAFIAGWINLTEYNVNHPGHVELFTTLAAEATSSAHPAHQYFLERYELVFGVTKTNFENMLESGQLRDGVDPSDLAVNLIALSDGLQLQWLIIKEVNLVEQISGFFKAVLTPEAWAEVESRRAQSAPELAERIAAIEASLQESAA
jgi:AcrR family transcriptional regulator